MTPCEPPRCSSLMKYSSPSEPRDGRIDCHAAPPARRESADHSASDEASLDNPLTTKQGWRWLVYKEPAPPALLSDQALAGLSAVASASTWGSAR